MDKNTPGKGKELEALIFIALKRTFLSFLSRYAGYGRVTQWEGDLRPSSPGDKNPISTKADSNQLSIAYNTPESRRWTFSATSLKILHHFFNSGVRVIIGNLNSPLPHAFTGQYLRPLVRKEIRS